MSNKLATYVCFSSGENDAATNDPAIRKDIAWHKSQISDFLQSHSDFDEWNVVELVDSAICYGEGRAEFQHLITLAQEGLIQCIVVSSFSQFSPVPVILEEYLQRIFPSIRIRFISILEGYDSEVSTIMDMNDTSESNSDSMKKNCKSIGMPPFGYQKGSDRKSLVIDPEPAKIIRKVFDLALEGNDLQAIASKMNDSGIVVPAQYNLEHDGRKTGRQMASREAYFWTDRVVRRIVTNPVYTGTLKLHSRDKLYNASISEQKKNIPEVYVFENDHTPIITQAEFDAVQASMPPGHPKGPETHSDYALLGHVRCGNCKHQLRKSNGHGGCLYCVNRRISSDCLQETIQMAGIEQTILTAMHPTLRLLCELFATDAQCQLVIDRLYASDHEELQRLETQQDEHHTFRMDLYERYTSGEIPLETYKGLKSQLTKVEIEEAEQICSLQEQLSSLSERQFPQDLQQLYASAKEHLKDSTLTPEAVSALIDQVDVYEDHICICWHHSGVWEQLSKLFPMKIRLDAEIPMTNIVTTTRRASWKK